MDEQTHPDGVTPSAIPPVPSEARELIRDWEFLFWAFLLFGVGRLVWLYLYRPEHRYHQNFTYKAVGVNGQSLKAIPYIELDLNLPWQSFDIANELTTKGIQKFVADYRSTLKRSA